MHSPILACQEYLVILFGKSHVCFLEFFPYIYASVWIVLQVMGFNLFGPLEHVLIMLHLSEMLFHSDESLIEPIVLLQHFEFELCDAFFRPLINDFLDGQPINQSVFTCYGCVAQ